MNAEYTLHFDAGAMRRWCAGAVFLTACFPFVSPMPMDVDTQPLCLIFALLLTVLVMATTGLERRDFFVLFAASASLVYLDPTRGLGTDTGKYVAIVAGMLILVAGRAVDPRLAYRLLRLAIIAYFIFSCLIMIKPDVFLKLQGYIVRAVNVTEEDPLKYRGVPTFATEPGLLGGLLVFFLIQLRMFASLAIGTVRERRILFFFVCATIFLTKSGTGYFFLMLYLGATTLQDRIRSTAGLLMVALLVFGLLTGLVALGAALEIDNRGLQLLIGIASGSTFGEDTSVLKRLFDFAIGFISLRDSPFGVGGNMVDVAVNRIAFAHGLVRDVDYGGTISLVSGLSWMIVAYGVVGLAFLLYVFFVYSRAPWISKMFALLFFSFSYSPAFPAIWILLAQTRSKPGEQAASVAPHSGQDEHALRQEKN
jgi:hypothetical protein